MRNLQKGTAMLVAGLAVLWANTALWLPIAFKTRGYWAVGGEWIIIVGVTGIAVWTVGATFDLWEHFCGEVSDGKKN